jgi:hypothetical protein
MFDSVKECLDDVFIAFNDLHDIAFKKQQYSRHIQRPIIFRRIASDLAKVIKRSPVFGRTRINYLMHHRAVSPIRPRTEVMTSKPLKMVSKNQKNS